MEDLEITQTTNGIQIEGFPDAVKFVQITEPKAKRITDLALHRTDLKFALECLEGINLVAEEPASLRQGLWLSAIVTFMKCFGKNKSRGPLSYKKIYKGKKVAKEVVEYFKSLRNKHLVHDDNSYAQCQTGAVLNKRECDHKIAKIICTAFIGDTLDSTAYSNLHSSITHALEWVEEEFEGLCNLLTPELEAVPYDDLFNRKQVVYTPPKIEEVGKTRATP